MWNSRLAALVENYSTGVLSVADEQGYPASVRCVARLRPDQRIVTFPALPALAMAWRGKACLLFHRHDRRLEGLRQLVLKGELVEEQGEVIFRVGEFVTANGRTDTDEMPHAGRPLHLLQFLRLGRAKARAYIQKRGAPWPPIDYAGIARELAEDPI